MFHDFNGEASSSLTSKYREAAEKYKGEGISFLMGDLEASQGAFQVSIIYWPVCFLNL